MKKPASANPGKLSESLCKRLNVYAVTAGAACAGMLTVQPASAQVVYTPAHIDFGPGQYYFLVFGDGFYLTFSNRINDRGEAFVVGAFNRVVSTGVFGYSTENSVEGYLPKALHRGEEIGSSQRWAIGLRLMANASTGGDYGNFVNVRNRYLGLKVYHSPFDGRGAYINYGWARFTVHVNPNNYELSVLLSGYAYESTPNTPIRAGQVSGTADDPVYAPEPDDPEDNRGVRSEPEPISQAIQQAPLGLLALGAQGLPFWRRPADAQH